MGGRKTNILVAGGAVGNLLTCLEVVVLVLGTVGYFAVGGSHCVGR